MKFHRKIMENNAFSRFKFVQEMEGVDFPAAVELLARKGGVPVEYDGPAEGAALQDRGPDAEKLKEVRPGAQGFVWTVYIRVGSST